MRKKERRAHWARLFLRLMVLLMQNKVCQTLGCIRMGNRLHGLAHGLQSYRIAEQFVYRLVDREMLGDQRGHAVIDQKLYIALLMARDRVNQQHGQIFGQRFGYGQSARFGDVYKRQATLCASDQAYGWDKLSLSLPILRREVVGSKYLIGLLANLALCALAAAMTVIYSAVDPSASLTENLLGLFCGEIISLLLMGLMLAITFKFGVEKSRYILIAVVWIPILVMAAIVKLDIIPGMVEAFDQSFNQLVAAPTCLPLAASLLACLVLYVVCLLYTSRCV